MFRFILRSTKELARQPGLFAGLVLALVAQAVFQLGSPLALKFIFDEGIGQRKLDVLFTALAAWGGLLVLFSIGTFAQEYFNTRVCVLALNRLRAEMFKKIQELPPDHFANRSPSEVANAFGSDISAVETAYVRALPPFLLQTFVMFTSLVLLFVIEWRLALVTIAALAVVAFLPRLFGDRATRFSKLYAEANDRVSAFVQENTATHAVIRLFGLGALRHRDFQERLSTMRDAGASAHMFVGLVGRTAFIGTALSQLVVIGVGGYLAAEGFMTTGMLIAFVGLLLRIGDGVGQLTMSVPLLMPAVTSRERLDDLLAESVPMVEDPDAEPVGRLKGAIRFDNVTFGYNPDHPILRNLSLSIEPGQAVAFVGPSGSGKSTVMALLLRAYRPQEGQVLFDGIPSNLITEQSLRANTSVVPQQAILFDATVRDNILVGDPDASEAQIVEAAKAANVHAAVMAKPDGYDTRVSATGGKLSGGERQRIATARAFLRDAPIMLLDEATSALDPASEEVVNKSVSSLAGKKTIAAVTHRLASAVNFDRIFVLKDGLLVEQGTHKELLAQGGLYKDLWDKQQGMSLDAEAGKPVVTAERLALVPFLSQCRKETLEELAGLFVVERHREGTHVFHQGDAGDKFYIVVHGRLEVVLDRDGTETVATTLVDGDFFGELALVKNQPRAAGIRAVTDSWCLVLSRQHFLSLLSSEPTVRDSISDAVTRILAQQ